MRLTFGQFSDAAEIHEVPNALTLPHQVDFVEEFVELVGGSE